MNKNIRHIIEEALADEVDTNREWNRLLSAIVKSDNDNPAEKPVKKRFLSALKYVAAIFFGICISSGLYYMIGGDDTSKEKFFVVETQKGEKSSVKLPDGTIVWMNACTKVEYSKNYGAKNRNILLSGEAYFEVARNPQLPFVVKVGEIDVTALGTTFNISAYPEDNELITTLFTGKVAVKPILTKQEVILGPKSVAIYYKDINKIEAMAYTDNRYAQWRSDYYLFEMAPLDSLSKTLERKYNVVFVFENKKIKNMRFSGSFRNNQPLAEILKIIQINTAIKYRINGNSIIIK